MNKMTTKLLVAAAIIGGVAYYVSTNDKLKKQIGLSGTKHPNTSRKRTTKRRLK
jgi:hypothetical protein